MGTIWVDIAEVKVGMGQDHCEFLGGCYSDDVMVVPSRTRGGVRVPIVTA